jgi:hypothetical protein
MRTIWAPSYIPRSFCCCGGATRRRLPRRKGEMICVMLCYDIEIAEQQRGSLLLLAEMAEEESKTVVSMTNQGGGRLRRRARSRPLRFATVWNRCIKGEHDASSITGRPSRIVSDRDPTKHDTSVRRLCKTAGQLTKTARDRVNNTEPQQDMLNRLLNSSIVERRCLNGCLSRIRSQINNPFQADA